ncbi:MAG: PspA/IM30 family protein [Armatimonadetes bacterium]|nr:PspA/IM30 family protein [Armatimonadota bacterium]
MLKRFWNYIKALLSGGLDNLENPDILLEQAQREMQEVHARNRERAVQAITQKNNLQQMVDDLQKKTSQLQAKAELALKRGNRDLALQLLKEKESYQTSLTTTQASLEQAIDTSEQVKVAIKREEEKIRQKTAEALAMKAQWKNAQIQVAINKALDGIGTIEDSTQAFGRAQAKIRSAQSEAGARAEMAKTRVENRLADLDVAEADIAAENALADLELKMGMGSTTNVAAPTTVTATTDSDLEAQLRALEQKVGSANG